MNKPILRSIVGSIIKRQNRMMSATSDSPLGFIGLGHMGGKMVENLSKDGRKIMVFDANKTAVDKVVAASNSGNKSVTSASISEMSDKCSIIFSMLPNDKVSKDSAIIEIM